jgi:thiol-disulfide isomerase/thioredoxin
MSSRQTRKSRRNTASQAVGGSRRLGPWILGAVGAIVVVIVAAVGIGAGLGGDDDQKDTDVTLPGGGGAAGEIQPMSFEGEAFPGWRGIDDPAVIGADAPTLNGFNFDGGAVTVDPGATGEPIMLVFLAHWCPVCNEEVPKLVEWFDSGGVPNELEVIGIATATDPSRSNYPPSEWLLETGWPWRAIPDDGDSTAARAYGVTGFPSIVLMDGSGKVVYAASGLQEWQDIDNSVRAALGLA